MQVAKPSASSSSSSSTSSMKERKQETRIRESIAFHRKREDATTAAATANKIVSKAVIVSN